VGMQGNGPGDGDPFRFGHLLASDNAFLNDAVVCRLVDLPWGAVPYLRHAHDAGRIDDALLAEIAAQVPVLHHIVRPPPRSRLSRWSERRELLWLKRAARPVTDRPEVADLAHRLGVIQDVYSRQDDGVTGVRRTRTDCGSCHKCADFCPTGLPAEDIGVRTEPADCIGCLYCWFVCPDDAIALDGPLGYLERQVKRYRQEIQRL